MRTLAAPFLAVLALSTTLTQTAALPSADACGAPIPTLPQMYIVAQHHGRAYALLDRSVASLDGLAWHQEGAFDPVRIAPGPSAWKAVPLTLTLVGRTKARVVTGASYVVVEGSWQEPFAMNAIDLGAKQTGGVYLAIRGTHEAVWTGIEQVKPSAAIRAWVKSPGFTPGLDPSLVTVSKIEGAALQLITVYPETGGGPTTYVEGPGGAGAIWGGYAGAPTGVVTVDGVRYAVLVHEGQVTPVRLQQ